MADRELGLALLGHARAAIGEMLAAGGCAAPHHPLLQQPGATFVTLMLQDELRGCIGSIEPRRALGEDVRENARGAAFRDPRFAPLAREEFALVRVEVSLLGPNEAMVFRDEEDLLAQLRPGVDGVVFEYGYRRSTFLPQVWESLPEPRAFMGYLKRKAGLPADFWDTSVKVSRYEVMKWKESGPDVQA